ncbi:hypothetical protein Ancab_034086 [Ancistrocladus abbreviatus]
MPLVRFEVKNEYKLGVDELYNGANREDPKAILDGVAVAGLVGILRQLGDLAEFAAEVFHGLQEQVISTASRSRKLMNRVQHVEAALPPLEKAMLSQTSHIHFAYTPGSEWHARIRSEQNHFICTDLPRFIMDSYEECREPPRLQLLDKFDTGGPGSCLKRYSDPTFFRRASTSSNVLNVGKSHKERKGRKMKKRRSKQPSGQFSHSASFCDTSNRMQFSSPAGQGQSSPTQRVCTYDMTIKSDHVDRSDSLGSRDGMGYIECVFQPSASILPDETKSMESYPGLDGEMSNAVDSVSPAKQTALLYDDTPCNSMEDKTAPGSSSVAWDEKTELLGPTGLSSGIREVSDVQEANFEFQEHPLETGNFKSVDQVDTLFKGEDTPKSIFYGDQLNEIESEIESGAENFVDALNTIESESENEFDCQTKREVELHSNVNDGLVDNPMNEQKCVEHHPTESESPLVSCYHLEQGGPSADNSTSSILSAHESLQHAQSSCNLPERELSQITNGSPSSLCVASEQLPEYSQSSTIPNIDFCAAVEDADGLGLNSLASESASYGSRMTSMPALFDVTTDDMHASQEPPVESSAVGPPMFWTNGNLLGLEPSKPPDFGIVNGLSCGSMLCDSSDAVGPSKQTPMPESDGQAGEVDSSVKSFMSNIGNPNCKDLNLGHGNQGGSSINGTSPFSHSGLDRKVDEFIQHLHTDKSYHLEDPSVKKDNLVLHETKHSVLSDQTTASTRAIHASRERSTFLSEFGRGFLTNGFRRTRSLGCDERFKTDSPVKTNEFENGGLNLHCHSFPQTNLKEQLDSPIDSPPPSPPLEHMKISFQPIHGTEISKLKLRYPDVIDEHEGTADTFPSFQLVPEPTNLPRGIASDSDDDTFCRSYPCMSDHLSHLSDSDSEVWESGDSSECKDHMLYDGLHRISSAESISSSPDHNETIQRSTHHNLGSSKTQAKISVVCSRSGGSILDLPTLDTMNLFPYEAKMSNPKELAETLCVPEPNPEPPPLPPLQWRASMTQSDAAEGCQGVVDYDLNQFSDPTWSGSAISQQAKIFPGEVPSRAEDTELESVQQPDEQRLDTHTENKQLANIRRVDDKEDFLQQIRTKSFNLRHIETARSMSTPGPTTSIKVTAILEKANAIRKAVGSDDGEDDNWSDA